MVQLELYSEDSIHLGWMAVAKKNVTASVLFRKNPHDVSGVGRWTGSPVLPLSTHLSQRFPGDHGNECEHDIHHLSCRFIQDFGHQTSLPRDLALLVIANKPFEKRSKSARSSNICPIVELTYPPLLCQNDIWQKTPIVVLCVFYIYIYISYIYIIYISYIYICIYQPVTNRNKERWWSSRTWRSTSPSRLGESFFLCFRRGEIDRLIIKSLVDHHPWDVFLKTWESQKLKWTDLLQIYTVHNGIEKKT